MSRARWLTAAALATVAACGGGSVQSPSPRASSPPASASGGHATPGTSDPSPGVLPTELILGQTFGLFYDPRLEQVVLVNGATEGGPDRPTELWRWSGSAWELLDAAGPPARSFAAIGRDPEREVLIVHGGVDGAAEAFDETLEWDGRDWSVATATGPGPREGAGLAFDVSSHRMVLFGGAIGPVQQPDTWAWDGAAWERIAEVGPRPRFVSLMTEDRSTDGILLQGGHWVDGNDGDFLADTWRWSDGAWLEVVDARRPRPSCQLPGRLGRATRRHRHVRWRHRARRAHGSRHLAMDGGMVGAVPGLGSDAAQRACPGVRRQTRRARPRRWDRAPRRLPPARRMGARRGRLASGMATALTAHPSSKALRAVRRSRQ